MKQFLLLAGFCLLFATGIVSAQSRSRVMTHTSPDGKYTYETVMGDPLKARVYTLANGLRVFMTVNKNEPRIQAYMAVKAGSKNDPADATGLAHYLEHMLFKGTDTFGSLNYEKEKAEIEKIVSLYEKYRTITDETKRKAMYRQIDSISGVAAKYAIANEYDKMMAVIGATGTNAYTSFEQTVYVNNIPANQLEKFLKIEGERFRNPVMRLFHTELEAVYEEKNISLDNDNRASFEALFASLFPTNNYGQQTTIGTVEHLKNPSIVKIMEYYRKYYVPNNMALCLSGDLDPDKTIELVDRYFGYYQRKDVEPYIPKTEAALTDNIEKEVWGPDAENVRIAFRLPGVKSREALVLELMDNILSNSSAGLIDLNLNQKQVILDGYSFPYVLNDYSMHILGGSPREGQTLEEVKFQLLSQIQKLGDGDFDEAMLKAVINNLEISQMEAYEENEGRADAFVEAFTSNRDWAEFVPRIQDMRTVTKQEIMDVVRKYYTHYVAVYKRNGERKAVTKVVKPAITPVETNAEAQSDFLKAIAAETVSPVEPKFLDYAKDIQRSSLASGTAVHYVKNEENGLFTLYYALDMGRLHDKKLDFAINYLPYLGTDKYTAAEIQTQFYSLGCSFGVNVGLEQSWVYLTGLQSNFTEGVKLFEHLLAQAKPDAEALAALVEGEFKSREDAKLNKNLILRAGMSSYGMYGTKNPFNHILTNDELKNLSASELTDRIHALTSYPHKVLYYGPHSLEALVADLNANHTAPAKMKSIPFAAPYVHQDTKENTVYFVNYDMVQAEILWMSKSVAYDVKMEPVVALYNQYYGGNMSSIVFQTIRESKALAYSTYSRFSPPSKFIDPFYLTAYVGTQADKIHEAMEGMYDLLRNMPEVPNLFETGKEGLMNQYRTERTIRTDILFSYESAKRKGLERDIRGDIFQAAPSIGLSDIKKFHTQFISGQKYNLMILGSKEKINLKSLEKYGKVVELSLEQVFGY